MRHGLVPFQLTVMLTFSSLVIMIKFNTVKIINIISQILKLRNWQILWYWPNNQINIRLLTPSTELWVGWLQTGELFKITQKNLIRTVRLFTGWKGKKYFYLQNVNIGIIVFVWSEWNGRLQDKDLLW